MPKLIKRYLSVRIALMVVGAMTLLLLASLTVMFHYSRKAVKEEATQKARETLEAMTGNIDNILLSVEQTTGNICFNMLPHINNPDMTAIYARKLVETNPYVAGCAIAFKEGYFKGRSRYMAYIHHADSAGMQYADTDLEASEVFAGQPYTSQRWFTETMATRQLKWMNPLQATDTSEAPIITLCLPIMTPETGSEPIGVIGVDVSLSLLSKVVQNAKPSKNSYCALIDRDGNFIVHPIARKLMTQTVFSHKEQSAQNAARAMMQGETGYKPFQIGDRDFYVFYQPFKRTAVPGRSTDDLGWSAGIIYPEDDIFGDYNDLLDYVLAIAAIGLLLSFLISCFVIHRQLKPLAMLTTQAQHIAQGHLDEPIPDSQREDEIGRLQAIFKQMQQSLAANIGELEELTASLKTHGDNLNKAYRRAQIADRMKTAFLHNMTNQMIEPSEAIGNDVEALCRTDGKSLEATARLVDNIQDNGNTIAELLNNLLNLSDEEIRKEADHV